jgi:hypothetical protein
MNAQQVLVIFAIAGALVYALALMAARRSQPPAPSPLWPVLGELGRLTFMAAMFALMFEFAGHPIHVF